MSQAQICLTLEGIKKAKRMLGILTDGELADAIGLHRTTFAHIKSGRRAVPVDVIANLMYQTSLEFDDLFALKLPRRRVKATTTVKVGVRQPVGV